MAEAGGVARCQWEATTDREHSRSQGLFMEGVLHLAIHMGATTPTTARVRVRAGAAAFFWITMMAIGSTLGCCVRCTVFQLTEIAACQRFCLQHCRRNIGWNSLTMTAAARPSRVCFGRQCDWCESSCTQSQSCGGGHGTSKRHDILRCL